jgi:G:T-mismatch repair DNA endonuclease (very short patch repair protein)/DNA-binding transcriptional MerR regulator
MKAPEVAAILGVPVRRVYDWARRGLLVTTQKGVYTDVDIEHGRDLLRPIENACNCGFRGRHTTDLHVAIGRRHVESGQIQALGHARKGVSPVYTEDAYRAVVESGRVQGRKNAENGHMERMHVLWQTEAAKKKAVRFASALNEVLLHPPKPKVKLPNKLFVQKLQRQSTMRVGAFLRRVGITRCRLHYLETTGRFVPEFGLRVRKSAHLRYTESDVAKVGSLLSPVVDPCNCGFVAPHSKTLHVKNGRKKAEMGGMRKMRELSRRITRNTRPELDVQAWLRTVAIPFESHKLVAGHEVDLFLPTLNAVMEVDGNCYDHPASCNESGCKVMTWNASRYLEHLRRRVARQMRRDADISSAGYTLVVIPPHNPREVFEEWSSFMRPST